MVDWYFKEGYKVDCSVEFISLSLVCSGKSIKRSGLEGSKAVSLITACLLSMNLLQQKGFKNLGMDVKQTHIKKAPLM